MAFLTSAPKIPWRNSDVESKQESNALLSDDTVIQSTISENAHENNVRDRNEKFTRIALLFFVTATILLSIGYFGISDEECGRQLSVWSPLSEAVEYEEVDFVNKVEQPSKYRGAPTHALEEHWEKLWFYGALPIPDNKMHFLNRSAADPWDRHPEGGSRALIEVFHQLHCLDIIRQYTYREYYPQNLDKVSIPLLFEEDMKAHARDHTDHCIEALRISIMCHGDVTPYLLKINPNAPAGVDPDFSPHHKCVKFELLVEYMNSQKYRPVSHNPHK